MVNSTSCYRPKREGKATIQTKPVNTERWIVTMLGSRDIITSGSLEGIQRQFWNVYEENRSPWFMNSSRSVRMKLNYAEYWLV